MNNLRRVLLVMTVFFLVPFLQPSVIYAEDVDVAAVEAADAQSEKLVLYVQEGCSHCAKVEAFIEENGLQEEFIIKDTSVDPEASEEYVAELERLGVSLEESGVPMLVYDEDQYLTGDTPIISLLEERFGIETPENDPAVTEPSDYLILAAGVIFVGGILGYGIVKLLNDRKSSK